MMLHSTSEYGCGQKLPRFEVVKKASMATDKQDYLHTISDDL
jgi:hypothetical protein